MVYFRHRETVGVAGLGDRGDKLITTVGSGALWGFQRQARSLDF